MAFHSKVAVCSALIKYDSISAASGLAGASAAQSIIAMPALLKASPTMLVKQFDAMSHASMGLLKPATMGSTVVFSVLTYLSYTPSKGIPLTTITQWKLFAAASVSAFAVIPYTIITLAPLGHKMEGFVSKVNMKSGQGVLTASEEQEVKSTLAQWTEMNKGRALLPFIASIIALVASVAY
jgi:hypothetical protein